MNYIQVGAAYGFVAISLGALGSHAIRQKQNPEQQRAWGIGTQYHLLHSIVIFLGGLALQDFKGTPEQAVWLRRALQLWTVGTGMFSGSIYFLSTNTGPKAIWPVTPLGGFVLMGGWLAAFMVGLKQKKAD